MAHQRSNDGLRRASIEEVAGETVSENVRGERAAAELLAPSAEHVLDLLDAADQRAAADARDHALENGNQVGADRPVSVNGLAEHVESAVRDVHVLHGEAGNLGATHARSPHQLDDVGVVGVRGADLLDGGRNVRGRDGVEAAAANSRHLDAEHRVATKTAALHRETDDATQRAQLLLDDGLQRDAAALPPVDVEADRLLVQRVKSSVAAENGGELEMRPLVEVDGALRGRGVGEVAAQQVQAVVQCQRGAGFGANSLKRLEPCDGAIHGRVGGPVGTSSEDRRDAAEAVAVGSNSRWESGLSLGHGAENGATAGATDSSSVHKSSGDNMQEENGGGRGMPSLSAPSPGREPRKLRRYGGRKHRPGAKRGASKEEKAKRRFWRKVDKSGGASSCWLWMGMLSPGGYGRVKSGGRKLPAHRIAFEWAKGPVPSGLVCDHLCGVRRCVNPNHLEAVTPRENSIRGRNPTMVAYRAKTCLRGHAVEGANAMSNGPRVKCRTCHNERKRASNLARRISAAARGVA